MEPADERAEGGEKMSRKNWRLLTKIILYCVSIWLSVLFLLPLIWMIVTAFKPENRIFQDLTSIKAFLPMDFTLENFKNALKNVHMLKYIVNSTIYISVIMLVSLPINSMCGYALAKFEFKGKKLILALILSLMVFPFESIVIPLFVLVNKMKLLNSMAGLIVPFSARCFSIYMFRQFFLSVPDEIIEAAEIDGATKFRTFYSVVVPISGPVFATVFILDVVLRWSDFMWPLIITISEDIRTVQVGVQSLFNDTVIYYGTVMAALTLAVLPMLVLFVFFQKYYVQGIATSGMKG